jgi:hypothetical protein
LTNLAEDLLLISLDSDGHPKDPNSVLGYALAGAALMELVLAGRLALGPKAEVTVADTSPTGEAVLDRVLARIQAEPKQRKLKWWVSKAAGGGWKTDVVRNEVIEELTDEGVLQRDEDKVLGLFSRTTHPPADPGTVERARAVVREAVTGPAGGSLDQRTAALVGLTSAAGLVDRCVSRDERRAARKRADQIARGEAAGAAVKQLHQEVMAAVLAAVAASSAASSSG